MVIIIEVMLVVGILSNSILAIYPFTVFSALVVLFGWQEGHPAFKAALFIP